MDIIVLFQDVPDLFYIFPNLTVFLMMDSWGRGGKRSEKREGASFLRHTTQTAHPLEMRRYRQI